MRSLRLFSYSAKTIQAYRVEDPVLSCRDGVEICLSSPSMKTNLRRNLPPQMVVSIFREMLGNVHLGSGGFSVENEGSCMALFLRTLSGEGL